MNEKLYVLVRKDLRPGQQAVQALHAAVDYVMLRAEARDWWQESNTVVVLEVKNRKELRRFEKMVLNFGIPHVLFREPDMWNQPMALAFESEPWMAYMVAPLRLALSKKRWWKRR